jgi:hypothetical protein
MDLLEYTEKLSKKKLREYAENYSKTVRAMAEKVVN